MSTINKKGIASISMDGINLIKDIELREALLSVYHSREAGKVTALAQDVFEKLTQQNWSTETLCKFMAGWRATHGTALYVSGLVIRIHREAKSKTQHSKELLLAAAGEICEIIPEDTGVDDTPHHELFAKFANAVIGHDNWKLNRYNQMACNQFRNYVQVQRLDAPIEEAILTTAASENWNTGEYTFFAGLIDPWLTDILKLPADLSVPAANYTKVHAGSTELGHFLHAIKAWQYYCEAHGKKAEPGIAKRVFEQYIMAIGNVYDELCELLACALAS
jgi:hypothetical protein